MRLRACCIYRSGLRAGLQGRVRASLCARGMRVEQRDFEPDGAITLSIQDPGGGDEGFLTPDVVCVLSVGAEPWPGAKAGSACGGGRGLQYGLS